MKGPKWSHTNCDGYIIWIETTVGEGEWDGDGTLYIVERLDDDGRKLHAAFNGAFRRWRSYTESLTKEV